MDSEAPTRKLEPAPETARDDDSSADARVGRPFAELSRGDRLSRYVLIDRLGAGGMGVVYRAYDPELDRQVALKVLHETDTGSTESGRRGDRLIREAQVLARLSHPNVVKVHDAGSAEGRIFIAMELIEGETLKQWIRAHPRPWREVLALFCRAGRGLAAAHAADVIHRDFKPENVLLGADGGVYVVDFGLARPPPARRSLAKPDAAQQLRHADISEASARVVAHLTESGTVLGTPAYMAPEQHAGGRMDGRTDQFAFCVALYEALYGMRPFPGTTVDELVSAVMRHQLRTPPRERRVPAALRRIVERGLSLDPADRFASMNLLLRRLEALPGRGRRRFRLVALGLGASLAVAGSFAYAQHRRATVCSEADTAADGVWNEARAQDIRRAFAATGRPYAAVTADHVSAALADYAQRWRVEWRRSCEATRVHGEQSAERFARADACLWRALWQADALTRELSGSDLAVRDRAVEATERLPPLDRCRAPAPLAAGAQADARAGRRELAAAAALRDVGKSAEAGAILDDLLEVSDGAVAPDVLAEARLLRAQILGQIWGQISGQILGQAHASGADPTVAEHGYYEAIWSADAAAADELEATAWIGLFARVAGDPDRAGEARRLLEDARAAVRRAGAPAQLESTLAMEEGDLARADGDLDAALRHYQRAFELRREAYGPMHLEVARALHRSGQVQLARGDVERAVSDQLRALAIAQDALGPDHPACAPYMSSLGDALLAQGKTDKAALHHDRARAIARDQGE